MKKLLMITDWFLDIVFPQTCLGCKARGVIICEVCIVKIHTAERETAPNILTCYDYQDPIIKSAVWNLKYYRKRHLGSILGQLLHANLIEDISDIKTFASARPILVVPTPLSRNRNKTRGYNQAEILAKNFCACETKEVFELRNDLICKKIDTAPQARIENRAKRIENIRGAFKATNEADIRGRTIIVIDDVTTTGATLTEIMKILKNAGAKRVVGFALAH
jgi:ComF family protein